MCNQPTFALQAAKLKLVNKIIENNELFSQL